MYPRIAFTFLALGILAGWPSTLPAAAVEFKVTTDRTVDNSSLESIVADVFRICGAKTNDEKAVALLDYLHATIFHCQYPRESEPQTVGPLKVLNVYGWGLCGGQHTVLKALYETAGWQVRYRGWDNPGHTTIEVFYDGSWHYLDVFLKCYYWTKDRKTIAGQDDINADPSIATNGPKDGRVPRYYLCCGDDVDGIISGCKSSKALPVAKPGDGWAFCAGTDKDYSPLLTLPSGASLRLNWKAEPNMCVVPGGNTHTCGNKDYRNDKVLGPILEHYGPRNWANGEFSYRPDFSKPADLADIILAGAEAGGGKLTAKAGKGQAVFKLSLPYPYAAAKWDAAFEGPGEIAVSTDLGTTWQTATSADISAVVRQKYNVWIKAEFANSLTRLAVDGIVEHNRCSQPYLLNGKNEVTVSLLRNEMPPNAVLSVTFGYQETTAPAERKRFGQADALRYGEVKTVTRKITTLPCTFTLEVGGNSPPKMLYMEREIRGK